MQVTVRNITTSNEFNIDITNNESIINIKRKISQTLNISWMMIVLYNDANKSRMLCDEQTITEYGITDGSVVWLEIRHRPLLMHIRRKPVIYLYSEEEMGVSVNIAIRSGDFTFVYPKFDEATQWNVIAKPSGEIIHNGTSLSYLFWEAKSYSDLDFSKGFVLEKSFLISFFEEKLRRFRLIDKEICDFITYWVPMLSSRNYWQISFQFENYDQDCPLIITPKPDNIIRVFMAAKHLDEIIEIPEQNIPTFSREGFTAIEWGGAIYEY